jgi:hypothetical protein
MIHRFSMMFNEAAARSFYAINRSFFIDVYCFGMCERFNARPECGVVGLWPRVGLY